MRRASVMALVGLAACAGPASEPGSGHLIVVTATTGSAPDPDGYRLELDGRTVAALEPSGSATIADLVPGSHQLRLAEVAPNCAVAGSNPRQIELPDGEPLEITFQVGCQVAVMLVVRTRTGGRSLDPDGFRLGIDGAEPQQLLSNGTLVLHQLEPGEHTLALEGIADNCQLLGDNPLTVTLAPSGMVTVLFDVTCQAVAATLVVEVTTTGAAPDPDGYTVSVNGGTARLLGTADSIEVPTELGAQHRVLLGDLAPLCSPDEPNPLEVEVNAVVTTAGWHVQCPGVPSTGTILYAGEVPSATHLFAMRSDGTERVDLTPGRIAYAGRWSPDGKRIVFEQPTESGPEVWVMDADGRGAVRIGSGAQPAWSPDGSRIALVRDFALHVMDEDGSNAVAVPLDSDAKDPAWFPDGRALVYSGENRDRCTLLPTFDVVCAWELRAVDLDGSNPRTLIHAPNGLWAARSPAFSPDGSLIAFWLSTSAFHVLDGALHVVAPDGTGLSRLEVGPVAVAAFPVWSPDGTTLAFGLRPAATDAFDVALVSSRGGEPVRILSAPGEQLPTSWR